MTTAADCSIQIGGIPNGSGVIINEGSLVFGVSQAGWDTIRVQVDVMDGPSMTKELARTWANAVVGSAYDTGKLEDIFYVRNFDERKLIDWPGWSFNLSCVGTSDIERRTRDVSTYHDNVTWTNEEEDEGAGEGGAGGGGSPSEDGSISYDMLIPRMTVVDQYFTATEPNWSEEGTSLAPPNAPTPPTLLPWASDKAVTHIPHGWVLVSREAPEPAGAFPGQLWTVSDTFTYFEELRPGS